jgi:two-component system sensor histidine kinase/response regulator
MILIVDDHPDTCAPLRRLLQASGFRTECVKSGGEALRWVNTLKPTLIILDEAMPEMTGLELLRTLREDPTRRDIPVIMLSGVTDESKQDEARELGALRWLFKGDADWLEVLGSVLSATPESAMLSEA